MIFSSKFLLKFYFAFYTEITPQCNSCEYYKRQARNIFNFIKFCLLFVLCETKFVISFVNTFLNQNSSFLLPSLWVEILSSFAFIYHRVKNSRGAKPSRLHYNWNVLLDFLALGHCMCAYEYIRWFNKEEWWIYFCRFVFVSFFHNTNFMNKHNIRVAAKQHFKNFAEQEILTKLF